MFKKVLIAEDLDIINSGLMAWLNDLKVENIEHTKYCDDAFLKIKKAIVDEDPFDLLISDLSFEDDFRQSTILSGSDLIKHVKTLNTPIKIVVFSIEDKPFVIKTLFNKYHINAYVQKGRNSMNQLKTALEQLTKNEKYISPDLAHALQNKDAKEINDYDIFLLKSLAKGVTIEDLPVYFQKLNISPCSKSSIEKHISKLKVYFRANNNIHLIAIAKDLGII
jgi:two-component system capsular synthesis response regulator RcsB